MKEKKTLNLFKITTYKKFENKIADCKYKLHSIIQNCKKNHMNFAGYGAAAKTTTFLNYFDISEKDIIGNYLKIRNELSKYDKSILKKKEIVVFNKSDLVNMDLITEKLKNFRRETKKNFEIISLVSKQNFDKVKKLIHNKCI